MPLFLALPLFSPYALMKVREFAMEGKIHFKINAVDLKPCNRIFPAKLGKAKNSN